MAEEQEGKKPGKKIIVDEDWKQDAQREKEILAAQEESEKKKAAGQKRPPGPLPKGNFAALISTLSMQAMFALGVVEVKGQEGQKREPDLDLAKYNIDMLETLEEKTRGNLTEEEAKVLSDMLNQVRMVYVKMAK
jgi:hypothetical protein